MVAQNNNDHGDESMAYKERCPLCNQPAFSAGKHNANGGEGEHKITHIYFTCSNVPNCGRGFRIVQSFGGYTNNGVQLPLTPEQIIGQVESLNPEQREQLKQKLNF